MKIYCECGKKATTNMFQTRYFKKHKSKNIKGHYLCNKCYVALQQKMKIKPINE